MPANNGQLEKQLWGAADELRANSQLKSSEYSVPGLGLIFLRYVVLAAVPLLAFSQSPVRIAGVQEPPELTGEAKKFTPPSDTMRQLLEVFPKDEKNIEQVKSGIELLSKLLQENPDYSYGYFMRALFNRCWLKSDDSEAIMKDINSAILKDINSAMSMHAAQKLPGPDESLAALYLFRAKVGFETGRYPEAMNDLEAAMMQNFDNAGTLFNSAGTAPDTSSPNICIWSLSDLDTLVQRFPKDYRALLFRGLYLKFFATFDEKYYQPASQEFQKAALINPKSPIPHFFIGKLYMRASFWTKAPWASDEGKHELSRKAILEYTKAIQLDARFRVAYEMRASAYHSLKQYREAIKDYDKVLELDPENVTAYADRGLAKLELGRYFAATVDLGDAIRRKKEDSSTLSMSYEYRADAYTKIGMYRDAIESYSQAIKCHLANLTFLLSLKQIRGLYPEYDNVSDEALIRKIKALFWPQFEYSELAKQLIEGEGKWQISMVNDLYEKRGDAYLRSGDFRRGVLDFNRIFKGIPNFAGTVGRWRLLGASPNGQENYVDVKSVEFADNGPARLWLKTVNKNKSYTAQSYDLDCKTRRLNLTSTVVYNKDDEIVSSSDLSGGWQRIIPETRGEQLFNGMCSASR